METLESYAANNIVNMHGMNMEYLEDFKERLPEPLIRFAIDTANKHSKNGKPWWGYVETILKSYEARGFTSVEQVQQAEEDREKAKAEKETSRKKHETREEQLKRESDEFWGNIPFVD